MPPMSIQNRRHKYIGVHQKRFPYEIAPSGPTIEIQSYSENQQLMALRN